MAWITGLLAALIMCATSASAHAAWVPDAWITAKTKTALLTSADVPAAEVHVDTVDGHVTLHGKVQSADQKAKAEQVARNMDGVKDVRNLLQVVPAERNENVNASDDQIQKQAQQQLNDDPALKDSSIKVQSVNGGVVLLSGKAASADAQIHALQDLWKVPGVRRVSSEIQSPDKLADEEIRKNEQQRASGDQPKSQSPVSDTWITTKVKMRLFADSDTPGTQINVDTRNGVVNLFGEVPDQKAKTAAEADARKVSGVHQVVNDLQVVPKGKQDTVKAQDDVIQRQVKEAIANRPELKESNIGVNVKNGVVRLTGSVPDEFHSLAAATTARSTAGVRSVDNQLRVSGSNRQGEVQGRAG